MTDPESKLRWYQFSLRSLLGLTAFVAVLCSIGLCIHWILSALISIVAAVGGIAGWIVGRLCLGFAAGIVYGACFLVGTVNVIVWFGDSFEHFC